ncbi:MAG: UDP-N-acetylglucosamine 1-carboxyvinyltransferase, partial [Bacteroidales bacterium]|nr:UDP-N-acetylglucosamine 1-carboxyvinyltransferase [Bacteroidales bacterium]
MATFKIEGGHKLCGELHPQGAKNEALQVICACLLTEEKLVIRNIPDIRDVNILMDLLRDLGVVIEKQAANNYTFCAKDVEITRLEEPAIQKKAASLRGSILIIGPLLARFGKGVIAR